MSAYIIRRVLIIPVLLLGVTILIFLMISLLSPDARLALYLRDLPRNENVAAGLIKRYGLDQPIYVQYVNWLVGRQDTDPVTGKTTVVGGLLRGELGWSRVGSETIANLIGRRFPATLELALWAVIPIIAVGIWMGVLAAVKHNKWQDQILRVFAILGYSFPTFVFGLLVLMLFYARLQWFPPGRLSDWASVIVNGPTFVRPLGISDCSGSTTIRAGI